MNSSILDSSEYNKYYQPYISILDEQDLFISLEEGKLIFLDLLKSISVTKLDYAYEEGKWSIAEILLHLIDSERIFQYRALRFARNDTTPVPGFEQDDYIPNSRANTRDKESIANEFIAVRTSTIALFNSFNAEELARVGLASNSEMSVRALGFVICGHLLHHRKIIMERYL